MTEDTIWVVTSHSSPAAPGPNLPEGTLRTGKGIHSSHQRFIEPRPQKVSTQKLEQRMGQFLKAMGRVFDQAEQQAKQVQKRDGLRLEEIELSVEIGAEGEVRLMGMGSARTGGSGAITLTFRRPSTD